MPAELGEGTQKWSRIPTNNLGTAIYLELDDVWVAQPLLIKDFVKYTWAQAVEGYTLYGILASCGYGSCKHDVPIRAISKVPGNSILICHLTAGKLAL